MKARWFPWVITANLFYEGDAYEKSYTILLHVDMLLFITSCSKTVDETSSINRYAFSPIVAEQVQKIEMRKSKNDCKIVTRQQDIQSCVSTINAFEKTYFVTEPKGGWDILITIFFQRNSMQISCSKNELSVQNQYYKVSPSLLSTLMQLYDRLPNHESASTLE